MNGSSTASTSQQHNTAQARLFKNTTLRKQSCSELISRLKSRKILGLNCDCKGETYRSKISQLLGNSETVDDFEPPALFTLWFNSTVIGSQFFYSYLHFERAFTQQPNTNYLVDNEVSDNNLKRTNTQFAVWHFLMVLILLYFQTCNSKSIYRFLMIVVFILSLKHLLFFQYESIFYLVESVNCSAALIYFILFCNSPLAVFDRRKLSSMPMFELLSNWFSAPFSRSAVVHNVTLSPNEECSKKNH